MFKNSKNTNKSLIIVALTAIVNALGYGIIIPVLYSYSKKFGLSDFQNGLLFSLFSICQFISTPIIGRLSDKYGRRPLLMVSLFGTTLSFILMAFAQSAFWLFIARIVDGITAGNISVASAIITDTTDKKDRAKGFGIIGASFGLGFVFGPAISGIFYSINNSYPFLIAAGISLISFVITVLFLKETNFKRQEMKRESVLNFKKMFEPIFDKQIGRTLLLSLLYSFAFPLFIYGFQPFAVTNLRISVGIISGIFTLIGVVGVLAQLVLIPFVSKKIPDDKILRFALFGVSIVFAMLGFSKSTGIFTLFIIINSTINSFISPMIQTILSKEVHDDSQGEVMGINSSYIGLGQIFGPLIGGLVASFSLSLPFVFASGIMFFCYFLSLF